MKFRAAQGRRRKLYPHPRRDAIGGEDLAQDSSVVYVAVAICIFVVMAVVGPIGFRTLARWELALSDIRHRDVCLGWVPNHFCSGAAPPVSTAVPPLLESCTAQRRAGDAGVCHCTAAVTIEHSCEEGAAEFSCLDLCAAVKVSRDETLGRYFVVKVDGAAVQTKQRPAVAAAKEGFHMGAHERVRLVPPNYTAGGDTPKFYAHPRAAAMKQYAWKRQGGTHDGPRPKAVYLLLSYEKKLPVLLQTLHHFERNVNTALGYPYAFFNDKPITGAFSEAVSAAVSTPITFNQIPAEHWGTPEWIDKKRLHTALRPHRNALYMDSLTYRWMCRWYSGFFYREAALAQYDWYWRVDDDVYYYCPIQYDPFVMMAAQKKRYAFTIAMNEAMVTIRTLWQHTKAFISKEELAVPWPDGAYLGAGGQYSGCHFWSNFEIASFDFFRSDGYAKYFNHLDQAGGFFYERWGDAPVHTLAAMLLLPPDEVAYLESLGYGHTAQFHIPEDTDHCPRTVLPERYSGESVDRPGASPCLDHFLAAMGTKHRPGMTSHDDITDPDSPSVDGEHRVVVNR